MSEQHAAQEGIPVPVLDETFQVRLVSDLQASLAYYRDALGFSVDEWGHAKRGGVRLLLQQAKSRDDDAWKSRTRTCKISTAIPSY